MLKRFLLMALLVLITNLAVTPYVYASGNAEKEAEFAEKVKSEIAKIGVGTDARIKVKLKDGTKLKGCVSEIKDTEFSVTDAKTGKTIPVPYSHAKQVKGNNLSSQFIIGLVVVGAIVASLVIIGLSAK
jgi:hypothetical protein